jgi:hypothetical protein
VEEAEGDEQVDEPAARRREQQREAEQEPAAGDEHAAAPDVAEDPDRGLDEGARELRQRQQQADLRVGEAEVVADQRQGRFARAEDELVEELDGQQDGDGAGGSAPAADPGLPGRMRHARESTPRRRGGRYSKRTVTRSKPSERSSACSIERVFASARLGRSELSRAAASSRSCAAT